MAQVFLESHGYHELPNDFYAAERQGRGHIPPGATALSQSVTLPIGPGAYGHYSHTQLANVFDLDVL